MVATWDNHRGRGKRAKIGGCHVILTNFYNENDQLFYPRVGTTFLVTPFHMGKLGFYLDIAR